MLTAFYLDSDIGSRFSALLESRGDDVTSAAREMRRSATDDEHLLRAADQGRILVTHNWRDFLLLHQAWLRWTSAWGVERDHAGILVIPQPPDLPIARSAHDVARFIQSGRRFHNELYRRRVGGNRATWERWRLGVGWTTVLPSPPSSRSAV